MIFFFPNPVRHPEKNKKGILANPVVATKVNAKFFIHQGLKIRRNENDRRNQNEMVVEQKSNDVVNIYIYKFIYI